jgi:hypothetical protein
VSGERNKRKRPASIVGKQPVGGVSENRRHSPPIPLSLIAPPQMKIFLVIADRLLDDGRCEQAAPRSELRAVVEVQYEIAKHERVFAHISRGGSGCGTTPLPEPRAAFPRPITYAFLTDVNHRAIAARLRAAPNSR